MQNLTSCFDNQPAGKFLRGGLWLAQGLMFAAFLAFGIQKIFLRPETLATMWQSQWPMEHPILLRITGLIDAVGGIGILLPSLTRILPKLAVLAALGCALLQVAAIAFHAMRNEFAALPLNFVLLAFIGFILWGRSKRAPVPSRG